MVNGVSIMKRSSSDSSGAGDFRPLRKAPQGDDGVSPLRLEPYGGASSHLSNANEQKADELRFTRGIRVDGDRVPAPVEYFGDLPLPPFLRLYLQNQGYDTPTPVQMQAIPTLLAGRDLIALAPTGSGKTLAYTLALTIYLCNQRPVAAGEQPRALILVPARELASQIKEEVESLLSCIPKMPAQPSVAGALPPPQGAMCPPSGAMPPPPRAMLSPQGTLRPPLHPPLSSYHQQQQAGGPGLAMQFGYQAPPHVPTQFLPPTHINPLLPAAALQCSVTEGRKGYQVLALFGGVPWREQASKLSDGVDVIVATPGRLLDLVERQRLSLDSIAYLAVDEVDRILSQGFDDSLRKIVALATSSDIPRQASLWSATLPESLDRLARSAVVNPITVRVGYAGLTALGICQDVIFLHHYQKKKRLVDVLRHTPRPPVLVFCGTTLEVDEVVEGLASEQFHVAALHGDLPQAARTQAIEVFRNDRCDVLVATDLASRGINIPALSRVINYTLPNSIEDYIHRCGRTSRMGVGGETTSFLTLDCKIAAELKDLLKQSGQEVPLELEDTKRFGKRIIITEFGDRLANS